MIAETVIPGIQSRGSKVVLSTGVEEILTHKGKAFGVRLENGDEIKAGLVISSAGIKIPSKYYLMIIG